MRVYELAKELNISAKKAVGVLHHGGFSVGSHMAVLDADAQAYLRKSVGAGRGRAATGKNLNRISSKDTSHQVPKGKGGGRELPVSNVKLVLQPMAIDEIGRAIDVPVSHLIMLLMQWGHLVGKNQTISADLVEKIAQQYNVATESPIGSAATQEMNFDEGVDQRLPVVVILGHVDHGKTTLLDFIRKTRVASREKGGITQHLGAYEAATAHGRLIFLDTPGHEAFTKIRQRGARVADIAVLVVSADDSLMPQSIEAINHIKDSGIPLVVAINKIDKVGAERIDIVKRDLAQYDLLPEEWGGQTVVCPISAKVGTNVDELLDLIALQAELLELKTTNKGLARGYVLESSMERGRGAVATVLLRQGELSVGDYFKAGPVRGRVSSIVDSYGKGKQSVRPSIPVRVAGFEQLPEAGDLFLEVTKAEYKKLSSGKQASAQSRFVPENALNLIVKTDTKSSCEALLDSIGKLSKKVQKQYKREFYVVDAGIGDVAETDVLLAESSGARIVALHSKVSAKARALAQRSAVKISCFEIIYKLLEELEHIAYEAREVVTRYEKVGTAVVRKVFDVKGLGVIAGCYVKVGRILKNGYIKAFRDGYKFGEGQILSLQSEKRTVKEVAVGRECGFIIKNISEWQENDIAECYLEVRE